MPRTRLDDSFGGGGDDGGGGEGAEGKDGADHARADKEQRVQLTPGLSKELSAVEGVLEPHVEERGEHEGHGEVGELEIDAEEGGHGQRVELEHVEQAVEPDEPALPHRPLDVPVAVLCGVNRADLVEAHVEVLADAPEALAVELLGALLRADCLEDLPRVRGRVVLGAHVAHHFGKVLEADAACPLQVQLRKRLVKALLLLLGLRGHRLRVVFDVEIKHHAERDRHQEEACPHHEDEEEGE
mmetsp:Transcript_55254/g.129314  ORF Transcript_55254/g.129314 Transcript_55254/m.129314 type:complete len:242 (-) Transcript_55254:1471-2196(-)